MHLIQAQCDNMIAKLERVKEIIAQDTENEAVPEEVRELLIHLTEVNHEAGLMAAMFVEAYSRAMEREREQN